MPQNAYIHIPFCKSKCKYCSFISTCDLNLIEDYVNALKKDITFNYENELLNTLYFGGGTPSLLSAQNLEKIISLFNINDNTEITIEINPETVNLEYFKNLKSIGFNRISIGSQTFNDEILKIIGRIHNSEQIKTAIKNAQQAGFENISVDLIYGLPTQNLKILKEDIEKFLKLNIQHISTYGLKIEETSIWGKTYNEKYQEIISDNTKYALITDDEQAKMYEYINEILEKNNFYRYEISNFALKNFESKHNLNYWDNNEYYGFGASAHGYKQGIRYSKNENIKKYIMTPNKNEFETELTIQEQLEEEIFLGLRKTSGLNIKKINTKFNIDFEKKYSTILKKYQKYFIKKDNCLALSLDGILISNIILAEFIE